LNFNIITLFPDFFSSPFSTGLPGKAVESGILQINLLDLRKFSDDRFKRCDDYPYGGGSGMVLGALPLMKALESLENTGAMNILPSPGGSLLNQEMVKTLKEKESITIICGHYEGIDQRVIDKYVDMEISVGDYILSGGEFAALVLVDSIARYIPGFMSNSDSLTDESFEDNLIEYPQYTRPEIAGEMKVPDVLLSGNHQEIREWRLNASIEKTRRKRPDLYRKYLLNKIKGVKNGYTAGN
jgi:tRNA (guanine37-N1)-methyltransferase